MEIVQFWRRLGRRRWLLVIAPIVAAMAAVGVGSRQPALRAAVTVVQVPVSNGDGPLVVRRKVADFQSLMMSDTVLRRVARTSHLRTADLAAKLTVMEVLGGSTVEVRYTGPPSQHPTRVTETAARTTVDLAMAQNQKGASSRLRQAQKLVASAHRSSDAAQQALKAFITAAGHPSAAEQYAAVRGQATQTTSQLAVAKMKGWTAIAGQLQARLDSLNKQVRALGPAADKFSAKLALLTATRQQTFEAEAAAQRAVVTARAVSVLQSPVGGVLSTSGGRVSRFNALAQLCVAGAIGGIVLAGLALLVAARASRRKRSRPVAEPGGGEDDQRPYGAPPKVDQLKRPGVRGAQASSVPRRERPAVDDRPEPVSTRRG